MKVCNNKDAIYGHIYKERKLLEVERNERFQFADQAAAILTRKKIRKDTEAYKAYIQGKLPPAHVNARAKRYAVKYFLSHYQTVAYQHHYKTAAPKPWIIALGGHHDYVPPPSAFPELNHDVRE